MRLAIRQIQRKRGKQKNYMQPGTAITRNKSANVLVTSLFATSILMMSRFTDMANMFLSVILALLLARIGTSAQSGNANAVAQISRSTLFRP